jgi:hypothetical protein
MTQQYREVKRKAAVGERIRIVNAYRTGGMYSNGDEFTVESVILEDYDHYGSVSVKDVGIAILDSEYVVLEPVESAEETKSAVIDRLTADVANLARRLEAAEREIAELKRKPAETAQTVAQKLSESFKALSSVSPKPLTRDEIVAQAKRDIAELPKQRFENVPTIYGMPAIYSESYDRVRFVVNRDKRTVIALLEIEEDDGKWRVWARGIARCAPDDCFNVHIGKAIALRRALGLPVPDEYVNAPQPKEARVGDIVEYELSLGLTKLIVSPSYKECGQRYMPGSGRCAIDSPAGRNGRIIDDSREEA